MVPASVGLRGSGAGLREVLAPWRCGSICRSSTACSRVHLGARHRRPRPVFFRGPDPDPATDKHDGHRPASAPIIRSFRPPSPYRLPTPACPLTTRTGTAQTISCLRGGQATDHESFFRGPDPDPATDKHDGHRPASAPIIRSFRPPSPYRLPTPACPLTTRTGTAQTISCLRGGQATDHESFFLGAVLKSGSPRNLFRPDNPPDYCMDRSSDGRRASRRTRRPGAISR